MTLPETPRSSAPEAPKNTLLIKTRTDLEKRWNEFDAATMQEARNSPEAQLGAFLGMAPEAKIRAARDADSDFQSAKKAFDEAKSALASIATDKELKMILSAPGRLASTIQGFELHLKSVKESERNKGYNRVLAETMADLTSLKAQMTENAEDRITAEKARAAVSTPVTQDPATTNPLASLEASVPAVATMVTGLGATVASTGLVSEKDWKKVLGEKVEQFKGWVLGFFGEDTMLGKLMGGVKEKLSGFFTLLKVKLGIAKPDETSPERKIENASFINDAIYTGTVTIVRKFFLPKDSGNAGELYAYKAFGEKTFSELTAVYKNRGTKSIKEALGIPKEAKISDKELEIGLSAVLDGSQKKGKIFISQCQRTCGPDFQNLTMLEIFRKVGNPLAYLKTLAQIDVTDNPESLFENFGFEIDAEGKGVGDLSEKADKLSLSSRKLLFISALAGARYTNATQAMTSLKQTPNWKEIEKDEKLRKECEDVFQFGEALKAKILNSPNIHLGYKEQFQEVFDKKGLSFRGLATLYCMLDGKTDFENMTGPEKLGFYGACGMLASEMNNFSKGGFSTAYLKKLGSDSREVPEDVKEFGKEILGGVTTKIASGLWESAKFILGVGKEAPELALGALALWYFGGKARRKMHLLTHH